MGRQGLAWLLWRETQDPPGGILADDMGLGKTLTMISLILKERELARDKNRKKKSDFKDGDDDLVKSTSTLIVCPASLIGQWEREVESKVIRNSLSVHIYHGSNRNCSAKALAKYDIVITTYGTLQSEVKSELGETTGKNVKKKNEDVKDHGSARSELLNLIWERIIL